MTAAGSRIRPLLPVDLPWAAGLVAEHFGSDRVVSRGRVHYVGDMGGLVAEFEGRPVGLLQYRIEDAECEVVVLIATIRRRGIGSQLLSAASSLADKRGCRRIWLVTTNENISAIGFYRAQGWNLVAIHKGAVRESRPLKPEIPELSTDGTPIEDEWEFDRTLRSD